MDLTQLANLGEFIGGVAVLVTLIYLAVQLRQNTRLTAAQLRQEVARISTEVAFNTSPEDLATLSRSMADPQSVSPLELQHACLQFMGVGNFYETLFYARERGEVEDDFWHSRRIRMMNLFGPARDTLWPIMKGSFGQRFQEFVDHELFRDVHAPGSWLERR